MSSERNSMNRGVNSESIPIDLIIEILARLPSKSTVRFRCVSKLWESMLYRPYFTELFLTRSSSRPRILFLIHGGGEWSFYSSSQPQNPYEKSSLVVSADFRMIFREDLRPDFSSFTSGLIYLSHMGISQQRKDTMHVICNPSTGRFAILPYLKTYSTPRSFLGFDPIGKQYKVLYINYDHDCRTLTLGPGKLRWRKIQCPLTLHYPLCQGICINGILYYLAQSDSPSCVIVCFDVRFEKFKVIDANSSFDWTTQLVNYRGKLGVIHRSSDNTYAIELRIWILEDVEKQDWSTYVYTLPEDNALDPSKSLLARVTSTGEIVLWSSTYKVPFYVFYVNPQRNTFHTVEIQGVGEYHDQEIFCKVRVFVDHVDDLQFNITNAISSEGDHHQKQERRTFESNNKAPVSIRSPEKKPRRPTSTSTSSKQDHHPQQERLTSESINKFDALCLLGDDE